MDTSPVKEKEGISDDLVAVLREENESFKLRFFEVTEKLHAVEREALSSK